LNFKDGPPSDLGDLFDSAILNRVELGGEWPVSQDFGLRVGFSALRIKSNNFGWQQGFLDALWTPWRRGHLRLYTTAGLGFGSVSSTYVVRSESWATSQSGGQYTPGDYRPVSQSSRPFLRVSAGIQLARNFALEVNLDTVSLRSGKNDPWPSSATSVGLNLILRSATN